MQRSSKTNCSSRLHRDESHFKVLSANSGLKSWYESARDQRYYVPQTDAEVQKLQAFLTSLPDGAYFPVRGRDFLSTSSDDNDLRMSVWDYGVAVKNDSRLFFVYQSGDTESLHIHRVNYRLLVHVGLETTNYLADTFIEPVVVQSHIKNDSSYHLDRVVMINHGWSTEVGPNYPLIRALESVALRKGWRAFVPDFRPSYKLSHTRARSERVRLIYEELLCLAGNYNIKTTTVALVGHSQGGACSAVACTPRIVPSVVNIKGLMMLGSENPLALDSMDWTPPVDHCVLVHPQKDSVIDVSEMRKVASRWKLPLHELNSTARKGTCDCWGDDVHHDFLAKDLLTPCLALFEEFLDKCSQEQT